MEKGAAHQYLVTGIGGHDLKRKALEDLAVSPFAKTLNGRAFCGDAVAVSDGPLKGAELHCRQRVVDGRQRFSTEQSLTCASEEAALRF